MAAAKTPRAAPPRPPSLSAELAARLFAPEAPALDAAREAVAGITSPAEAWETLAARELIPLAWVGHSRVFASHAACTGCAERAPVLRHAPGCTAANTPPTVTAAVTLAAVGAAIERVEALAVEALARMTPDWRRDEQMPGFVWRVPPSPAFVYVRRPGTELTGLRGMGKRHERDHDVERAALRRTGSTVASRQIAWALAVDAHRDAAFAKHHADRLNPFAPVMDIWRAGFALEAISDDLVVLLARDLAVTPSTASGKPAR